MKLTQDKPLILIVDDIPKNLQILSGILSNENFEISFASSGKQALTSVEAAPPDLILLDIMMPELDGYQVCKILKSNDKTKDIPIIFLTGKAEPNDITEGFKAGAVDYVIKPFNSQELISRVNTHIELKLSRDKILENNIQLEKYQVELKQLIASKDKFFSIISHDLRGPFSGFLGLSSILAEEYDKLEMEEIAQISISMNKAANRLFSLLENLLEWSKSQMDVLRINIEKLNIDDAITRTFYLFSTNAESKNIKLISEVPNTIFAYADNYVINTVLRNLVSNAIKFSNENGTVKISTKEIDNKIHVYISDSGVGIDPKNQSKIFKIEEKYSTSGTKNEIGSGLGLILCKELIEKQYGTLRFESEPGKGTTFIFTLDKA